MILRSVLKFVLPLFVLLFLSSAQAGIFGAKLSSAQAKIFGGKGEIIKEDGLSKLKKNNVKQVVVPYFKVNVHTKLNKTARAKSGLFGTGKAEAKSSMFTEWVDPDLKMLQQVADDAWKVFEKQLTTAGFEVVPLSKVIATDAFKKINGSTEPLRDEKFVSLAPRGLKLYDPAGKIDPNGSFFLGVSNMNSKLESDIAREVLGTLDGVAVARITLNLTYGTFETEVDSHYVFEGETASAKVDFVPVISIEPSSPTVTPEITGIELQSNFETHKTPNGTEFRLPKNFSRVHLNAPMLGSKSVSQLEEITTAGEKAAAASVELIGKLLRPGTDTVLEVGKYVAHVNGESFSTESINVIGKLAEQIGQKIATAQ